MLTELFIWFFDKDKKWKIFNVDTLEFLGEFDDEIEAKTWMKEQEVA